MYGTLEGALAARHVEFDHQHFSAKVTGTVAGSGRTIRITAIHVHYEIRVAAKDRSAAERALEVHPAGCPAHESVKDAIKITWDVNLEDL